MSQAIFLSYASQDAEAARRICEALRAAGLEVWFDQSELRGGDAWDAAIRKQIKECALFVPIISANTNARPEGYFRLEWKLAVDRSHLMADNHTFFFPVILGEVSEPAALVPEKFRERQWSRLNDDQAITAFATRVGKIVSGSGSSGENALKAAPMLELSPSVPTAADKADDGFRVAVLPFKHRGTSAEIAALADGLAEEVLTGLSRFSYLRVIARAATLQWTGDAMDLRAAGHALGARYVLDGTVRQSGSALRVAVQLIDTESGANLWADTYNRGFTPDDIFALQDDLVPRIVSTVADAYGVLPHSMSNTLRGRTPEQLTPYEAVMRSFGHYERVNAVEHALVRDCLEHAVKRAPIHSDCLAALAMVYAHEYGFGLNPRPDPLQRALETATRAVEFGPANHSAFNALAMIQHYRGEFEAARRAAERAMALNPMDASTNARMGLVIAYGGDWETGCAIIERARHLNPQHADWYWAPLCFNAYRLRDYRGAITLARNINRSDYYNLDALVVASHGQLGERETAANSLRDLLASNPEFPARARGLFSARGLPKELVEHIIEGLHKGGMDIPNDRATSRPAPAIDSSTVIDPVNASASIAVLAFANRSASADDEYFSDGLADELLNVLAKIKGLRVAARTSAFSFKGKSDDIATIGQKLNVATVLEGSVRKSGNRVRISVQLIKVDDGFQLWGETYDRTLDDIFAVQDDIAQAVVKELRSTLLGESPTQPAKLAEEIAQANTARSDNPEALRLCMQARFLTEKRTDAELRSAMTLYQQAIALDPSYAAAYAGLARALDLLASYGTYDGRDPLALWAQAKTAAEAAVTHDPQNTDAYLCLARQAADIDRNMDEADRLIVRALELNPNSAEAYRAQAGQHMKRQRHEEWRASLLKALALDPIAMMTRVNVAICAMAQHRYDEAEQMLNEVKQMNPGWWAPEAHLARLAQIRGNPQQAIEHQITWQQMRGNTAAAEFTRAAAAGGWEGYMRAAIAEPSKALVGRAECAYYHLVLGDVDAAFRTLHESISAHDESMWMIVSDPRFEPLYDDPRYAELVKRTGFME